MGAWEIVTGFLKKVVPAAASVFIPGGGLVSTIISAAFDVDATDPKAVGQAIKNATPDQILTLKKMVLDQQTELFKLAGEQEKTRLNDVQDARQMSTELVKITGKSDHNKNFMSWITLIGFLATIIAILSGYADIDDNPVVMLLLGALISHVDQVYGYWFGSSKSSTEKTNILASQAQQK